MKSNLQFFSTRSDMIEFFTYVLHRFPELYVTIQRSDGSMTSAKGELPISEIALNSGPKGSVYLTAIKPDLLDYVEFPKHGMIPHFSLRNNSFLEWTFPELRDACVYESHLFSSTELVDDEVTFKRCITEFRKRTVMGSWGLDPRSGLYQKYRIGRWFPAAVEAERHGVIFKQFEESVMLMFSSEESLNKHIQNAISS